MPKGSPNDESMLLNFVAKIWDDKAKAYKPVYIAPDATNDVRGDVYLSDDVNDDDNAESGVTAATPAAVKKAYDEASKKIDKTTTTEQSMSSSLSPTGTAQNLGSESKKWNNVYANTFHGNLTGTADKAKKLAQEVQLTINTGKTDAGADITVTQPFTGESGVTWNIQKINASLVNEGLLPIKVIPKAALF